MASDGLERGPITVVFVARVLLYREGVVSRFQSRSGIKIVGTAATYAEAKALVEERHPDVVVIDMATDGALEMTNALRTLPSPPRVIAFAVEENASTILDCAEAGAHGFVTVGATLDDVIQSIQRVLDGELLCTPRVVGELFRGLAARSERRDGKTADVSSLTGREEQVLGLLARGLSNKEIGASLHIAEATVKNHVHNLLEKLHVGSRGQAAARALLPANQRRYTGGIND